MCARVKVRLALAPPIRLAAKTQLPEIAYDTRDLFFPQPSPALGSGSFGRLLECLGNGYTSGTER